MGVFPVSIDAASLAFMQTHAKDKYSSRLFQFDLMSDFHAANLKETQHTNRHSRSLHL